MSLIWPVISKVCQHGGQCIPMSYFPPTQHCQFGVISVMQRWNWFIFQYCVQYTNTAHSMIHLLFIDHVQSASDPVNYFLVPKVTLEMAGINIRVTHCHAIKIIQIKISKNDWFLRSFAYHITITKVGT